jgi:hypothetical protein
MSASLLRWTGENTSGLAATGRPAPGGLLSFFEVADLEDAPRGSVDQEAHFDQEGHFVPASCGQTG